MNPNMSFACQRHNILDFNQISNSICGLDPHSRYGNYIETIVTPLVEVVMHT